MNFSRLGRGEFLAVLGGVALALSLFLPWYKTNPDNRNAMIDGMRGTVSGWTAFPILHWVLLGYRSPEIAALGFTEDEIELVRKRLDSTHWKRRLPTVAMLSATAIGEYYLRPVDY